MKFEAHPEKEIDPDELEAQNFRVSPQGRLGPRFRSQVAATTRVGRARANFHEPVV
jgi:hypothetical protein